MELPFLDTNEILRDRLRWRPIGRGDAVHACRFYPVAVVHRIQSRYAASWLVPSHRFFRSDGPYAYEELRYYLFSGTGARNGLTGSMPTKPEPVEMEPMEALDMAG